MSREFSRRTALEAGLAMSITTAFAGFELVRPTGAHADTSYVIGCGDWGARPPSSPITMLTGTTRKIIVHHMEFPNSTDYSREHAIQLAKDCQNLHMDHNGWIDTGQHFTISRGGYVLEGRYRSLEALNGGTQHVQSAHCIGENNQAIGIENEGTYFTELPPQALWDSLVLLCTTICQQYRIHPYNLFGHWDYNSTDCPGVAFYKEFPRLRLEVARALGQALGSAPARVWPDIYSSNAGATVQTAQYLLLNQGFKVPTDGSFNSQTVKAVQRFQSRNALPVSSDGTVTDATWELLGVRLDSGSTGNAVRAAQNMLAGKGYQVAVNGTYDSATRTAVQQVQALHGLASTGAVDTSTWCAIVGGIVAEEFAGP